MISITHKHQFKPGLTGWVKQAILFIGELLSFEELWTIEKRKQKELHEAGLDFLRMI